MSVFVMKSLYTWKGAGDVCSGLNWYSHVPAEHNEHNTLLEPADESLIKSVLLW